MHQSVTHIDSPGVEPVPVPAEATVIGGRAESWTMPQQPEGDDPYEPTIIRGRE